MFGNQARILFPFISNLDVFDLSRVSLLEHRFQDSRYASVFFYCHSNVLRQLKTESQWKDSNPQILTYYELL